jgi:hypothetical protein
MSRPIKLCEPIPDFWTWYEELTGIDVSKVERVPTTGLETTASDTPDLHTHTSAGIIYTDGYLYHLHAEKDDTHVVAGTGLERRDIIQISRYNFSGSTAVVPASSAYASGTGKTTMTFALAELIAKGYDQQTLKLKTDNIGLVVTASSTPDNKTYIIPGSVIVAGSTYTLAAKATNTHTLADAGKHKYDKIELKLSDGSLKILAGTQVVIAGPAVVPTTEAGYIAVAVVYVNETSIRAVDIEDQLPAYRTGDIIDTIVSAANNYMVIGSASWNVNVLTIVVAGDFATNDGVKFDVAFRTGVVSIKKGIEHASASTVPIADLGQIKIAEVGTETTPFDDSTTEVTSDMIVDCRSETWLYRTFPLTSEESDKAVYDASDLTYDYIEPIRGPVSDASTDIPALIIWAMDENATL